MARWQTERNSADMEALRSNGESDLKKCITCGADGHTYIECPRAPFATIVAGAMGVPPMGGPSLQDTARELRKIEAEHRCLECDGSGKQDDGGPCPCCDGCGMRLDL